MEIAMPGRIVILNGVPRSGKSSLARAVQDNIPGQWINWGVDACNAALPPALMPGIGLRPGGERPDLEPQVALLYASFFAHMARLARQGFDVVADLGLHRDYATGLDPVALLERELAGLTVLLIGVDCGLETIMARRNADPQGGFYLAGPGIPEAVQRWQDAVHKGMTYRQRLDMGALTPEQGAALLAQSLHEIDSDRHI
jgi:chloramphenicol 3-O phosphotransferase